MKYDLKKQEVETLSAQIRLIGQYQQIVDALQLQFRTIILSEIFPRVKLQPEMLSKVSLDLLQGTLSIPDKEEEPMVDEKNK